jgi:NSS family neurotransmitter:Na+ symporter
MALIRRSLHGGWGSRWTFIAAVTLATVGLGNLWKFAYLAGANGGAGFVLIYLAAVLLVAAPVLVAELVLGSRGRADPIHSLKVVTLESAAGRGWRLAGWLGCLAALLVLSYFSVVSGWLLVYLQWVVQGELAGGSAREIGELFGRLLADAPQQMAAHGLFMGLVAVVVALGVRRGLGLLAQLLLPLLFLLLVALAVYAVRTGDTTAALAFMFSPRSVDLRADGVLTALGHAFFSLSLGMGAMMAYGAYAPDRRSIMRMVGTVVVLDTAVALLAGLAIFPLVFAHHVQPSYGPGLMFVTLPYVFANEPYGMLLGIAFFALVALASLGSAVALLEPATAWLVQRFRWRRAAAAVVLALLVWLLGLLSIFSFSLWPQWRPGGRSLFAWIDWVSADLMLPLGGLIIALFVGWRMRTEAIRDELFVEHPHLFALWRTLLRYIAAPAVAVVLVAGVYRVWGQ